MFRLLLAVGAVLFAFVATPAAACRLGGDELIFDLPLATPEGERFATVAKVRLEGEYPGPVFPPGADGTRGLRVGTAHVLEVVRGPELPPEIPVYLEVMTSCSNFFRRPAGPFVESGYVVGRLMRDAQGPYLWLAELNDVTWNWR